MAANEVIVGGADPIQYFFRNYSYPLILTDAPALSLTLAPELNRLVFKNSAGTPHKIMVDSSGAGNLADGLVLVTTGGGKAGTSAISIEELALLDGATGDTLQVQIDGKLTNSIATSRMLGRLSADAGPVEQLTAAQIRGFLNVADGANAYTHPNHTGAVTSSGDGATTITNSAVTFAKIQNVTGPVVVGRQTATAGVTSALSMATLRTMLNVADGAVASVSLDQVTDPAADKAFSLANRRVTWNFTNPAGGMAWNFTGAATGHSLEIKQVGGNPGADMHLLHIEASDTDPTLLHLQHAGATSGALKINVLGDVGYRLVCNAAGRLLWGTGVGAGDASIERSGVGALRVGASLTVDTIAALGSAGTVFLTHTAGLIQSRTAAQVLGDIGAQATLTGTNNRLYRRTNAGTVTTGTIRETDAGLVGIGGDAVTGVSLSVTGTTRIVETLAENSTTPLTLLNSSATVGTEARLHLGSATTRGVYIAGINASSANAHDMVFATSAGGATPVERMRLNSNGLGIGGAPATGISATITGKTRITTVDNGAGDFLTRNANGDITRRTASEVRGDIGAEPTIVVGEAGTYYTGNKAWSNFATDVRLSISATSPIAYNNSTGAISHVNSASVRHVTDTQITAWDGKQAAITGLTVDYLPMWSAGGLVNSPFRLQSNVMHCPNAISTTSTIHAGGAGAGSSRIHGHTPADADTFVQITNTTTGAGANQGFQAGVLEGGVSVVRVAGVNRITFPTGLIELHQNTNLNAEIRNNAVSSIAAGGSSGSPLSVAVAGKNMIKLTPTAGNQYYILANGAEGQRIIIKNRGAVDAYAIGILSPNSCVEVIYLDGAWSTL